jgi:hypothetical protein
LKVLANLLAGEFRETKADPGKVRRAARRLEAMDQADLETLSVLRAIFDEKERASDYDGHYLFLDDTDVVKFQGRSYVAPETIINGHLADFVSRGLLFIGANPQTSGGQYFYKTKAFDEIIFGALRTITVKESSA